MKRLRKAVATALIVVPASFVFTGWINMPSASADDCCCLGSSIIGVGIAEGRPFVLCSDSSINWLD